MTEVVSMARWGRSTADVRTHVLEHPGAYGDLVEASPITG
jgi:hypothetical protein